MAGTSPAMTEQRGSPTSSYRLVHGNELGPVRERRLDLNFDDHFGDAVHHLRAREHMRARLHQLGDRLAVARALDDEVGDERHRLGMIELDAALEAPPVHHRGHGDEQLVLLARGQMHGRPAILASPQLSQSRGNGAPRSAVSTATRSCRSAAPSAAHNRATANPFQAETPTSPRKRSASTPTLAAVSSSAGTASTVATAMPPAATARCRSFAATRSEER